MPRGRRKSSGSGRLEEIVSRHVSDLVEAIKLEVRRNVADEVRAVLANVTEGGKLAFRVGRGRRGRRRIIPCIAPSCKNPSKGPRFHYLCETHKDAPKKDYEAWRKARQEKKAA